MDIDLLGLDAVNDAVGIEENFPLATVAFGHDASYPRMVSEGLGGEDEPLDEAISATGSIAADVVVDGFEVGKWPVQTK